MPDRFTRARNRYQVVLVAKSLVVGLAAGAVVTAYRLSLNYLEDASQAVYALLRTHPAYLPLWLAFLAAAGLAVWRLVRWQPMAAGSGIAQIRGKMEGYVDYSWWRVTVARFVGGTVSIFAGLSLGRGGPSVHLGSCIAEGVTRLWPSSKSEKRFYLASGASAGLAATFCAPLAGVMFAMETVYGYFSTVTLMSGMVAAVAANYVAGLAFGFEPMFAFAISRPLGLGNYWLLVALGVAAGLAGSFFNWFLLASQRWYGSLRLTAGPGRMVVPFLLACAVGLWFPLALGGGRRVPEILSLDIAPSVLLLALAVKFLFSMLCFASAAPGGIFYPLLVMGALLGGVFGSLAVRLAGVDPALFEAFVVLAMVGFFTAIVRAPITAVLLLMEMSGSLAHMLPLTIVAVLGYVTPSLLGVPPIYESFYRVLVASPERRRAKH